MRIMKCMYVVCVGGDNTEDSGGEDGDQNDAEPLREQVCFHFRYSINASIFVIQSTF